MRSLSEKAILCLSSRFSSQIAHMWQGLYVLNACAYLLFFVFYSVLIFLVEPALVFDWQTIVGHGALDFGLIKINQTKNHVTVVTDRWSKFFKVPKRGSEEFEVEVPLNLMEPTTKHELIDIEYLAHVSIVRTMCLCR